MVKLHWENMNSIVYIYIIKKEVNSPLREDEKQP
jgi:hypothetical protein